MPVKDSNFYKNVFLRASKNDQGKLTTFLNQLKGTSYNKNER